MDLKQKTVLIFSGGLDSVSTAAYLKSKRHDIYGITFVYGQKGKKETEVSKKFSKILGFRDHQIIDIGFMKRLYGDSNVLTSNKRNIPKQFNYSIVAPIRNGVFVTIAAAWAFSKRAEIVAYGAHTGDGNYPDCRPSFAKKAAVALNQGEIDGIKSGQRKRITVWSPFNENFSKSQLLKIGYGKLGDKIFDTWSCYKSAKYHCGVCESCNNRKKAFYSSQIEDLTAYRK